MKRIIFKIFLLLAFILNFTILAGFCEALEINSITYDNSGAILSINSFDTFDYQTNTKPIVRFVPEEQKLYFDLQPAKLKGSGKDYVINSDGIEEISIAQFSQNPETVRVVIKYNDKFNPANICLKRINNTFFVRFKQTIISNYYFQEIYKESGTQEIYEPTTINQKIIGAKTTFNQINSAFNTNSANDGDIILTPKDQILKTKYYIDSISFRGAMPVISGTGAYTLSKPIYLTSPSRVAFDIKNAVVNPVFRNKDIPFGTNDSIKIGQFNQNTARIVITTPNPENYIPVLYGDAQRLALYNPKTTSALNLYSSTVNMTAVNSEKIDDQTFGAKLVFNNPLIFGIDKSTPNKLEINLYNVNNYFSGAIKSELRGTPFENAEITDIKGGGAKFTLSLADIEHSDIYIGGDGKTLRIRVHTASAYIPKEEPITEEIQTPKIVIPAIVKPRKDNKKYVMLDAGHGGSDCGAIRNNINEKDIVLDITKRVEKMLKKKGYVVAMTRDTDKYVSLEERVDMSEVFNPDIFISIHVNSSNSDSPYGIETHYYKDNSLMLAKYMHAEMLNNINSKDRGLFKSKFYVINHTTAPAVLLEVGFISNPQERAQLVTESRKNATAKAIVEGIDAYFK